MSVPAGQTAPKRSPFHKYWVILSTRTQEDMAYRSNYVFGAIFRFLPLVTTIFLWYAIYQTRKAERAPHHDPGNELMRTWWPITPSCTSPGVFPACPAP